MVKNIMRRAGVAALPVAGSAGLLGVWWAITAVFDIPTLFLPGPQVVAASAWQARETLWLDAGYTLYATLIGLALAVAVALPLAGLFAASWVVRGALTPVIVAVNAVPKIALAPLLLLWLGFGSAPRIVLVWAMAFFPILISTLEGLRSLPAEFGELARSMNASRPQMFLKFRMPWALHQVFTGLKVAVNLAVIGAVLGEVASPNDGLGALIVFASANADTPLALAACGSLALISLALFYAVAGVQQLALGPWSGAVVADR